MNLDKLRVFYYAALAKSFSHSSLNLSPSAVSRHISDLEHSLKVKLFNRSPRGISLTLEGEQLLESCHRIFQEIEIVTEQVASDWKEAEGLLRIMTPGGWISTILVQRVKKYLQENPKIRLSILSSDRASDFSRNEFDILFTTVEPESLDLNCAYITSFHLGLYASPEYLKKFGVPEKVSDLDHHHLISYSDEKSIIVDMDWHLKIGREGVKMREPYMMVNNPYYAGCEGFGIVTLAKENMLLKEGGVVPVLPEVEGPMIDAYCVYPARLIKSRRVMSFVEFIRQIAEDEF